PALILTMDVPWQKRNAPLSVLDGKFYENVSGVVDQMNMMTYGMADNWGGWVVWHSAAVTGAAPDHPSSIHATVEQYRAARVPSSKLGVGIGFFGACWSPPAAMPLQPPGTSRVVASDNEMSAANIRRLYYRASGYRYDASAQASYLSFPAPVGPR